MPLNILKHKSWNVYNASNVERVRRDEDAARRKEEEEEMRMQDADREQRLNILQARAAESRNQDETLSYQGDIYHEGARAPDRSHHDSERLNTSRNFLNLEESIQRPSSRTHKQQRDHERKEREKTPWYTTSNSLSQPNQTDGEARRRERDEEAKLMDDPLLDIQRHLRKKREVESRERPGKQESDTRSRRSDRERRRRNKSTERHKRDRRDRSRSRSRSPNRNSKRSVSRIEIDKTEACYRQRK